MFEKIRRMIGKRGLKKYHARYLQQEQGLSAREAREAVCGKSGRSRGTAEPRRLSAWIVSDEGRTENDLGFILQLVELLLEKVAAGALSLAQLKELVVSDNPFREMRMRKMVDTDLERMLAARDAAATAPAAPLSSSNDHVPRQEKRSVQVLFKHALTLVQGMLTREDGPSPEALRLQKQKREQYVQERARMERAKMAALANSPEFLESLGAPDHFESKGAQKAREERVVAKEQKKLRTRLSRDDVVVPQQREKTPKELAEEKMRMLRKLKGGSGISA